MRQRVLNVVLPRARSLDELISQGITRKQDATNAAGVAFIPNGCAFANFARSAYGIARIWIAEELSKANNLIRFLQRPWLTCRPLQ
jgi:hypothetical protein